MLRMQNGCASIRYRKYYTQKAHTQILTHGARQRLVRHAPDLIELTVSVVRPGTTFERFAGRRNHPATHKTTHAFCFRIEPRKSAPSHSICRSKHIQTHTHRHTFSQPYGAIWVLYTYGLFFVSLTSRCTFFVVNHVEGVCRLR